MAEKAKTKYGEDILTLESKLGHVFIARKYSLYNELNQDWEKIKGKIPDTKFIEIVARHMSTIFACLSLELVILRAIDNKKGKGIPKAEQFLERMAQESELESKSIRELQELFSQAGMRVDPNAQSLKVAISAKLTGFEKLSIDSTKKTKELLGILH